MSSDAVIFIPGIKGTKLVNTNRVTFDTIWSGLQSNFETVQDLELTSAFNKEYYDENIKAIIRPGEIEELAYSEFIDDLKTDKPIFIFNYDWRLSASENGQRLATFITYLIAKSKASSSPQGPFKKFDFITHSLGNSILRSYLKDEGFAKVNKIVFTVPPFLGSIDIASALLIGEGWFPNVKAKIRKLIRTFPGALELLPTYPQASSFDSGSAKHNFFTFEHWQGNVTAPDNNVAAKFKQALAKAQKTIRNELLDLSTLSAAEQKRILVVCRTGYKTFQSIRVIRSAPNEPKNFFDFENAKQTDDGDGRVPDISSCHYHKNILTLVIKDSFAYREYSHGFILKDERAQKLVNRFLFGKTPFDYNIPGSSIKKVNGLNPNVDSNGMAYWEIVT